LELDRSTTNIAADEKVAAQPKKEWVLSAPLPSPSVKTILIHPRVARNPMFWRLMW